MRRLAIVVALLVIVPIIEITVLVAIGQVIGFWPTLLLVLATSALGGWLLRREGGRAWNAFRADLEQRRPPGNAALDGALVVIGGIFMLVPGFVSDVIGLFFIVPVTRRLGRAFLLRVVTTRLSPTTNTTLFGPRTVRVRYGDARPGGHGSAGNRFGAGGGAGAGESGHFGDGERSGNNGQSGDRSHSGNNGQSGDGAGEAIEGEIIDPK